MVRVVWSKRAADELDLIREYIEQFDAMAAARLGHRLFEAGESLASFPNRGRPDRAGRRVLTSVWPYLVYYRVEPGAVRILTIRHGARRSI